MSAAAQQRSQPILVDEFGMDVKSGTVRQRIYKTENKNSNINAAIADHGVERATFELMNKQRVSKGLTALVWNDQIAEVARLHSIDMARNSYFSHRGLDGKMVDERADILGVNNWRAIGENIAFMRGYNKPDKMAVEKWMDSTSHRRNMLSPTWSDSAIGVAVTPDGTYYFTQVFVVRK